MSFPLPEQQLQSLRLFVELLKNPQLGPSVLHMPQLEFFREYLLYLGATLPPKPPVAPADNAAETKSDDREDVQLDHDTPSDIDVDEVEEQVEADVVNPDEQAFGDLNAELTDEMIEKSDNAKNEARSAASEGNWEKAVQLYTEAILNNPGSASLIAKRAEAFLKLSRPNAAVYDCDQAIKLNKNGAAAHFIRGKAEGLLGQWEEALRELQTADQLDGDCGAYDLLREYQEKAQIQKEKRLQKEKKAADKKKNAEQKKHSSTSSSSSGFNPFEGAGEGGAGAGLGGLNFADLLKNPEIMGMLANPKVQQMMGEVMADPSKLSKYLNDPELGPIIQKVMGSFGMGGGAAEPSEQTSRTSHVDVDVD